MFKHNCMEQCYAKLKLAAKEKEEAKQLKVEEFTDPEQCGPPALQVASIAAPDQKDAPQDSPVAPPEPQDQATAVYRSETYRRLFQRYCNFRQREKREMWPKLYGHIARNVKRGLYPLKPPKRGQCAKCRHFIGNYEQTAQHQENCRADMYELGCPCGFLCSTRRSLAAHRGSCGPSSEINYLGDKGWLPYISPKWRECQLFDEIRLLDMIRNGTDRAQPTPS